MIGHHDIGVLEIFHLWSAAGIVRCYVLDGQGLEHWQEQRELSLVYCVQTSSVAHPGSFSLVTGESLSGVKQTEHALTIQHYSIPETTNY